MIGMIVGAYAIAMCVLSSEKAAQVAHDVCWCNHHADGHDQHTGACLVGDCVCSYYAEREAG